MDTASILAYSSHSRYYQEPAAASSTAASSYQADAANPRHVVWDDDEEEEQQEVETPQERQARLNRERMNWKQTTQAPLQEQLINMANAESSSPSSPASWMEFLVPPFQERSKVALPVSHQSQMLSHWDSYNLSSSKEINDWKEDVLFEEVRRLLEDCDTCQGVSVTTQGHGVYAGLTTALLEEFQEECKSAGRMVFYVTNPTEEQSKTQEDDHQEESSAGGDESSSWQNSKVDRLRRHIASGFAWNDFTEHAHLVLPLRLDETASFFESTARLAMALEACTLPFRLQGQKDSRYKMGLQNAPAFWGQGSDDTRWGTTAQRLSMQEFIAMLQPSSQYSVLELDVLSHGDGDAHKKLSNEDLWKCFQSGTSVERDMRMRERGHDRHATVLPGTWLQDTSRGGILSSRSFVQPTTQATDRSLHHHFALSTSVRPVLQDDIDQYLTSLVQGMGIQYRPERSMCTVVHQTVGELTSGNGAGAAGAYWRRLGMSRDDPVVAVLGNTSRPYSYLKTMATDMKSVLGPRYRGYYQRDVSLGILPEVEDCQEALANCWDLVDAYQPPDGSGLVDDDDADIDF